MSSFELDCWCVATVYYCKMIFANYKKSICGGQCQCQNKTDLGRFGLGSNRWGVQFGRHHDTCSKDLMFKIFFNWVCRFIFVVCLVFCSFLKCQ